MDYLSQLNPAQAEAVTTTEGYIRVVAGAGSGKTKTLTARYMYLVDMLGISTANILCVTFTNKAAAEMKKRIRRQLPDQDLARITTFHGFCVSLLKEDCHVVGYPKTFLIMDEEDKKAMLSTVFEDLGITGRDITIQEAIDHIGWRKGGRGYVKTLIDSDMNHLLELTQSASTLKDKILYRYFYEQRKCFALDFDDLIYFALYILNHSREVREKWQQRLEYVMVDEFQDIDKDQYSLADILSGYHKNLFVVGDPDQTIYTWRGADVKFILEFPSRHPGAKTIYLNENYRSAPQILAASNALIEKNRERLEKRLTAVRSDNRKPLYFHAKTSALEADWITANMRALHEAEEGIAYSDMGVLYRAHYVSRALEESLIKNKIPYVLYSGVEFYKRKEIKDVLSYLRMVYYPDDISFLRTVNEPKRGVGRTRIAVLKAYAAGITSGISATEFGPNNLLDRQQMATFLHRTLQYVEKNSSYKYTDYTSKLSSYTDNSQIASWAKESMAFMNALDLITGTSATTLSPGTKCTIEQAVTVAERSIYAHQIGWYQVSPISNGPVLISTGYYTCFEESNTTLAPGDMVWVTGKLVGVLDLITTEPESTIDDCIHYSFIPAINPYTGQEMCLPYRDIVPVRN